MVRGLQSIGKIRKREHVKYEEGDYEACHVSPIWRDRANSIFAAYLGKSNDKNEWEQLWGQETSPQRYILCCIPFFVYDLALGDEVEVDKDYSFKGVIKSSGQTTFRIWFLDKTSNGRQKVIYNLGEMNAAMEWSSENFLAISIDKSKQKKLIIYLNEQEKRGFLQFEIGQSSG